jgi:glutathione S-transferase
MKGYQVLEDALKGKEYLVNDTYSAADIAVSQPTTMNGDICDLPPC